MIFLVLPTVIYYYIQYYSSAVILFDDKYIRFFCRRCVYRHFLIKTVIIRVVRSRLFFSTGKFYIDLLIYFPFLYRKITGELFSFYTVKLNIQSNIIYDKDCRILSSY
uniref:Uncharacterized protein n=1 Tax=Lepeophtheirus salmonis TaxID=72036 RepID=A0A0K2VJ01_LEPSM